jgi:hypothetical protein
MMIYRITRFDASNVDCRILEDDKPSRQLQHIPLHSPTGFNTGYFGSGPCDLALAILTHFLGEDPQNVMDSWRGKRFEQCKPLLLYKDFMKEIVGSIILDDNESYDLHEEQIGQWISNEV